MVPQVTHRDLGHMKYAECWDLQRELFCEVLAQKSAPSAADAGTILFVEHPHVYTLGKSGQAQNMLIDKERLSSIGAEFFHIDRGGDITYHGPGQLVGYPIIDLERLGLGLRDYIDIMEQAVIDAVAHWGIEAIRVEGASGVWIQGKRVGAQEGEQELPLRKICAIGVRASRYVTMHGFALNVTTDLSYFNHINPCGFVDRTVTSIQRETGSQSIDMESVKELVLSNLEKKLNVKIYKK